MTTEGQVPIVRRATAADLVACAAIVNRWIDETDWMPRTESAEAVAAHFADNPAISRAIWVAELDGGIAGYLSLSDSGFVRGFYVDSRFRGTGVGKALMDNAKAQFPDGLSLTAYEPNHGGRAFYAREGFVEDPDGHEPGKDGEPPTILLHWKPAS